MPLQTWWFCCDKSNVLTFQELFALPMVTAVGYWAEVRRVGESRDRADGCYSGSRKRGNWSNMTHVFWGWSIRICLDESWCSVYDEGWCVLRVAGWGRMIMIRVFMMMVLCMMCMMIMMILFKINHFTCITCIVEMVLLLWLEGYLNRLTFAAWWRGCR